jgi:hypothetical protein
MKGAIDMHIVIAPFRPKQGITEDVMLQTSDDFDEQFVRKQDGILKRILVKDGEGGYADIVFFNDAAAIDRVMEAEQNSDVCAAFFALIDDEDHPHIYEAVKTYDR